MTGKPSWAAVGTMDEPAPLVLAWAAHHLSVGAAEVHIFLDRENPEVEQQLAHIPNAFVTLCDNAYWAASESRARPIRHTARQKHNAARVHRSRPVDWVMHCDADEFLDLSAPFREELDATKAHSLRLINLERVRTGTEPNIFAGGFRGPIPDPARAQGIYGRWHAFLDQGMAGYKGGKDIVRTGEDILMGGDFPIEAAPNTPHPAPYVEAQSARILHFDGMTPLHNAIKLLKRATEPKYQVPRKFGAQRERQFRFAKTHVAKPQQLRKMLDGVFAVTPFQSGRLKESFVSDHFDPGPALAELGIEVDLTIEAFDTELRQREAELIAKTGLRF